MAHARIFAFNLFFAIMLISMLSIVPGRGLSKELHLSWSGIPVGNFSIGAFDVVLSPASGLVAMILIITAVAVVTILMTVRVVETGLEFPPFKLMALVIGVVFVAAISGTEIFLISDLPVEFQFVLVFPSMVLMLYSLVMDIGTWGAG